MNIWGTNKEPPVLYETDKMTMTWHEDEHYEGHLGETAHGGEPHLTITAESA